MSACLTSRDRMGKLEMSCLYKLYDNQRNYISVMAPVRI